MKSTTFNINNHILTLYCGTRPEFESLYHIKSNLFLLISLLGSGFLWLIIHLLVNTRYQALKQAQQMMMELKINNDFIKESEAKYRAFFEGTAEGILVADIETKKFKYANPAICRLIGYSEDELKKMSVIDIHPENDLDFVISEFEAQARGEKILASNIPILRKDKSVVYTDFCTAKAIIDGIECNVGFITDVTERKQSEEMQKKLEDQLQQSQKMDAISTLAGGIAHDFNNMLGVIIGNLSFARSIVKDDRELSEILEETLVGAKNSQSLTRQLLTFSKGGEPIKKNAYLNPILKESATFATRGSKVRCEFHLKKDLWSLKIDEGQIYQVISNLVINSIQAMPEGGMIQIYSSNVTLKSNNSLSLVAGDYINVKIKDQGIGISDKYISKIFDPFFTTKKQGNGIGLSTAYSIIKKHGGHISVNSKRDLGTTFTIYLPANKKCAINTNDNKKSIHNGQGKILIMDDQEPILKMVGRMLKSMGYESSFATDGVQAIEIYQDSFQSQKPFDLIILDLTVPGGMGGAEAFAELLKIDPRAKAIVSSGYSHDPIMANYKDYGFCGVIPKPYTKRQLANVLNKILGEKKFYIDN